jgi:hypothetical protein
MATRPITTPVQLRASVMGFNGTKNACYDSPFAFYMSYLEMKKRSGDYAAMKLAKADRAWILRQAEKLIAKRHPSFPAQHLANKQPHPFTYQSLAHYLDAKEAEYALSGGHHKTIRGKVYTYRPLGTTLWERTFEDGRDRTLVKHLPSDLD